MKLQILLLAFMLSSSSLLYGTPTGKPGDPALDADVDFNAADVFQNELDAGSLEKAVAEIMAMPEAAGEKFAVRVGSQFAVVDRTMEAKVKTTPSDTATIMDKILNMASRSTGTSASMRITWQHEYIDANGKIVRDNLQFDIGVATGAAAQAQAEMEAQMSKQIR